MEQAAHPGTVTTPRPGTGRAAFRYLTLRTLLLVAVGGVLYLLGLRGIWMVVAAFAISGVIALFALSRQRDDAAGGLESAITGVNRRFNRAAAAEDEYDDEPRRPVVPASDPGVGVQAATDQVDPEEVDQEGRKAN
jgi:hypothetical protein